MRGEAPGESRRALRAGDELQPLLSFPSESSEHDFRQRRHTVDRNELGSFESLDYDTELGAKPLFTTKKEGRRVEREKWLVCFLIGLSMGIVAFCVNFATKEIGDVKFRTINHLIREGSPIWVPYVVYVLINTVLVAIASLFVTIGEPVAAGSGIPEIKCYLNGVNVPRLMRLKTLACKVLGVVFAVSGGLAIGMEGPMVHTGAILAAGISQGGSKSLSLDTSLFSSFRNDHDKRDFVTTGTGAGLSAAFGAPTGGVLFGLEEASSFWNQDLTWRTFFACLVSSFTLNFLLSGYYGDWGALSYPGLATFGSLSWQPYTVDELPMFLLLGVMGGLLGACFNFINESISLYRKARLLRKPWVRFAEAVAIGMFTAVCSFGFPLLFSCKTNPPMQGSEMVVRIPIALPPRRSRWVHDHYSDIHSNPLFGVWSAHWYRKEENDKLEDRLMVLRRFTCPEGEYNPLATIIFNQPENAIRDLFHQSEYFGFDTLVIFAPLIFILAVVTYGIAVPSGHYIPFLLVGAAFGRLAGELLRKSFPSLRTVHLGNFAFIGAAATLGGITRMTISITVILMECTGEVTYGLPIMMVILTARWVANHFTPGIYDIHVHLKNLPFLEEDHEGVNRQLLVRDVMSSPPVTLHDVESVERLEGILRDTQHNAFPVVNGSGGFLGTILRSKLCVLLKERCFSEDGTHDLVPSEVFRRPYPRMPVIAEIKLDDKDRTLRMDLRPYINPAPYTVTEDMSLRRAFVLFRSMGLRHLCVVPERPQVTGILARKDLLYEHRAHAGARSSGNADP